MKTINFITFIASLLMVLGAYFFPEFHAVDDLFFGLLLIFFGIPHGAVDHLIAFQRVKPTPKNKLKFYSIYLGLMLITAGIWIIAPNFSFVVFLIISAYHFGQSQLYDLYRHEWIKRTILYTFWGFYFFTSLFHFNRIECTQILATIGIWQVDDYFGLIQWKVLWQISLLVVGGFLCVSVYKKHITIRRFAFELLVLGLLTLGSFIGSAVLSFSIYFGLWHSFRSLGLEFIQLRSVKRRYSLPRFLGDLVPYSLIAIAFLVGVYLFLSEIEVGISPYVVFIIVISSLTVPHLLTMHKMYRSFGIQQSVQH